MAHHLRIERKPHYNLAAIARLAERGLATARHRGAQALNRLHRFLRRTDFRLANPGPPLHERGDWTRVGPLEMTPEREALISDLSARSKAKQAAMAAASDDTDS